MIPLRTPMPKRQKKLSLIKKRAPGYSEAFRISRELQKRLRYSNAFEVAKILFDGGCSAKELAPILGLKQVTVYDYLDEWESLGLIHNPNGGHKWYLK